MTVGIEVRRGSDNALLLTYNLQNPILVDEGIVTSTSTTLPDGAGSVVTVPNTGTIRTLYVAPGIAQHKIDATHWWVSGPVGTSAVYCHFANATPAYTNTGIEVYADAAGLPLRFSSGPGNKVLRADWVVNLATDGVPDNPGNKEHAFAHGVVGWFLQDDPTADPVSGEVDFNHWIQRKYVYAIQRNGSGFGTGFGTISAHCVDAPLSDPGWVIHVGAQRATVDHPQVFFMYCDVTGY